MSAQGLDLHPHESPESHFPFASAVGSPNNGGTPGGPWRDAERVIPLTRDGGQRMAKEKKLAFGGYSITFNGCTDTVSAVFGDKPIPPSEMTKKLWAYVKRKKLARK